MAAVEAQPTHHWRPLAMIPEATTNSLIEGMQGRPNDTAWVPSPILRGQCALAAWAARFASGLNKRPAPTTVAGENDEQRKIKLSQIISQSRDEEVKVVAETAIADGLKRYKKIFGCYPPADQDVTLEQITGVSKLITTGELPYVDFAVWVPHSQQMVKKLKLQ
eukprot:6459845-Amphidinium_carterae.1